MQKAEKIYVMTFKFLGSVAPVFLLIDYFNFLPENGTLRGFGYVFVPLITIVMFVMPGKTLDKVGKVIGWVNIAFVIYVVLMLGITSVILNRFD